MHSMLSVNDEYSGDPDKKEKSVDRRQVLFRYKERSPFNNFNCEPITDSDILVKNKHGEIRIIVTVEGELLTSEIHGSSLNQSL